MTCALTCYGRHVSEDIIWLEHSPPVAEEAMYFGLVHLQWMKVCSFKKKITPKNNNNNKITLRLTLCINYTFVLFCEYKNYWYI